MPPLIIHLLEITTLALVVLAAIRVKRLVGAEQMIVSAPKVSEPLDQPIYVESPTPSNDYQQKMECLKLAQAFAGNQLLEIKRELYNLNTEQPEWLREAVGLYLIGAIDFIGKKNHCQTNSRKELIEIVLKSNLKISREKAKDFFVDAVCREPESDGDRMVIAGARAAKSWLETKLVPDSFRLQTRIQDWGILA
jgi:hypothetical protein